MRDPEQPLQRQDTLSSTTTTTCKSVWSLVGGTSKEARTIDLKSMGYFDMFVFVEYWDPQRVLYIKRTALTRRFQICKDPLHGTSLQKVWTRKLKASCKQFYTDLISLIRHSEMPCNSRRRPQLHLQRHRQRHVKRFKLLSSWATTTAMYRYATLARRIW